MNSKSLPLHKLKFLSSFWNSYWFSPSPLFNLAICRIVIVGFQLYYLFNRDYWSKIISVASVPAVTYNPLPIFQILNAPTPWDAPPLFVVIAVFLATIASGILALIGLKTNPALIVFAIGNIYIQTYIYSFGTTHHSQAIMLISLFALALSPAGKLISVDDFRRRLKLTSKRQSFQAFDVLRCESTFARWPLLLIQWMFAFLYLSAALNKTLVDGEGLFGADWMNGYTLQYYLISDGLLWDSDLGVWLGQFHVPAIISSWFAVLFEGTFFLTLFSRRLVWIFIPLGAMLHTGIYLAQRAPFFQYIALYAVFIPWAVVFKRVSNRLKWSETSHKADIFYEGRSPLCIRTMTLLCYFDWFHRLNYHDLEAHRTELLNRCPDIAPDTSPVISVNSHHGLYRNELHSLLPNGSAKTGFLALREIIKYVPPLWILLIPMYFPGAGWLGSQVYR